MKGLHHTLRSHTEELSQTQREIIVDEFFAARKRANIAARRGISVNTCGTHRQAAFRTRRDSMTTPADVSTEIDLPDCFGRIGDTSKHDAARQRRRASRKKENRSNFEGDRSNFEGDRSNSRGDAEKNERAPDHSVGAATKS